MTKKKLTCSVVLHFVEIKMNTWSILVYSSSVTSGSIRLKTAVLMDISFAVLQNHYALSTSQIVIPQSIKSHQKEMRNPCSLDSTS
jgi:hypothetical protein